MNIGRTKQLEKEETLGPEERAAEEETPGSVISKVRGRKTPLP